MFDKNNRCTGETPAGRLQGDPDEITPIDEDAADAWLWVMVAAASSVGGIAVGYALSAITTAIRSGI